MSTVVILQAVATIVGTCGFMFAFIVLKRVTAVESMKVDNITVGDRLSINGHSIDNLQSTPVIGEVLFRLQGGWYSSADYSRQWHLSLTPLYIATVICSIIGAVLSYITVDLFAIFILVCAFSGKAMIVLAYSACGMWLSSFVPLEIKVGNYTYCGNVIVYEPGDTNTLYTLFDKPHTSIESAHNKLAWLLNTLLTVCFGLYTVVDIALFLAYNVKIK